MVSKSEAFMELNIQIKPLHVMATSIGRQTRFAGATGRYWWSVLHHSFLVENIISDLTEDSKIRVRDAARLYALLHDLHEAYTNDIPTPYKSKRIRAFQQAVDRGICEALCIPEPCARYKSLIKTADERAMWAEAVELRDPYCWLDPNDFIVAARNAQRRDRQHVRMLLAEYGSMATVGGVFSRGVQDYVREVTLGVKHVERLSNDNYSGPSQYVAQARTEIAPFIPNPNPEVADA
jgi:5'-deoxynucleotidase YfbR-like HD superfamily hydrolase